MLKNQQGFIHHLVPILLVLGVVGLAIFLIFFKGKSPLTLSPKEPTISLKSEYKNPFAKNTQYINPFDQYKSPLANLKK